MYFAHPAWLLLLFCIPLPWLFLRRKGFFGYSDVRLLDKTNRSSFLHRVPAALMCLSFVALTAALATPQQSYMKPTGKQLSRDVIFGIDVSGSMTEQFDGKVPAPDPRCAQALGQVPDSVLKTYAHDVGSNYQQTTGTRQAAAAGSVENFICQSYLRDSGDRVGLLEFSDSPTWLWPLSGDLSMVFRESQFIPFASGSGTNFGGTPPGPLDFSAAMFKQIGQARSRVFILVTDGEDSLSTDVKARLIKLMRDNGIHFYVISVGEDLAPRGQSLSQDADIAQIAITTGGAVFQAQSEQDLNRAVETVDQLTRSPVQVETTTAHNELFMYCACAFLLLFTLGLAGEAVVLRR
jgi:Mg-chelatase subunit ChlD